MRQQRTTTARVRAVSKDSSESESTTTGEANMANTISAAFPYQNSGGGSSTGRWRIWRWDGATPSCCCTAIPPRRTSGAT
jgi:hypothetical protein